MTTIARQAAARRPGKGRQRDVTTTTTIAMPVGPVIRRHRLGAELRRLRETRTLRLEDAAAELGVAASTLSRIETGQAPARTSYMRMLLDLYQVTDPAEHQRLADLAREGRRHGWWGGYDHVLPSGMGDYLGLETAAAVSRTYALQAIPALLQAPAYTTAACRAARPDLGPVETGLLAEVTRRRQEILTNGHRVHAIIDESALLRVVGTTTVMTTQLAHLWTMTASSSCLVQILTLSRPHPVLSAPFTVLSFPDPADQEVACRADCDEQFTLIRRGTTVSALRRRFDALSEAAMSAEESAAVLARMVAAAQ
jgi:transcriptional regulator with XRE-family HTH domain